MPKPVPGKPRASACRRLIAAIPLLAIGCLLSSRTEAATISDFFPNCASPSDAAIYTLTVDPASRGGSAYFNIAAALKDARPGDTVALMTGAYGELAIDGINQNGFITIAAAPGQTPRFTKITVGGSKPASHWRLTGLTVSSMSPPANGKWVHNQLILVSDSDNIVIDHNNVSSKEGVMEWLPELPGSPVADAPSHGIGARQSSCVSIVENHLHNLFHGIDFGGDQTDDHGKYFLVSGNSIDNFAGDGIEHYGSHVRIENNRITDGHDVCNNQCVHSDGIQGWNYNNLPVHNSDVVIDGNVIIAQITPGLAMPIDALQGITIFDGSWDDVRVFNNLVVVDAWHGITFNGVRTGAIVNNTLAPANPARNTWIMVNRGKKDPPETVYDIVVRNNVVPGLLKGGPAVPGGTSDHNMALRTVDDFADAFVKFDPEHFAYDLHLVRRSPVIGEGSAEGAPATDIEGKPRHRPIDIGAYAYQAK